MFGLKNLQKKNVTGILSYQRYSGKDQKHALLIYISWAIKDWINHSYKEEHFNGHSMYWESIEMVKILSAKGYNVDIADCMSPLPVIDWNKYHLIIDERDNLSKAPDVPGQLRVHYATGCQWLFHNAAEYKRLLNFRTRTGLSTTPQRQTAPVFSEQVAHHVTYFGGEFQKDLFTHPEKTFPLNLSSAYIPAFQAKNIDRSRNNFIWLGSRGFIHKGLDIVLEAFKKDRVNHLHICTNLEAEPEFYNWFNQQFSQRPNIHYHGWKNINDAATQELAEGCIATIYCSAAEGGAGAVVQAMQFGCIPLVNDSTALRGERLGYHLAGKEPGELIESIGKTLAMISALPQKELSDRCDMVRTYANQNHSREAYHTSFVDFIEMITLG